MIRFHAILPLVLLTALAAQAQSPATLEFHFENPGLQPAAYVVQLHEDGSGHFHATPGQASADDIAALPPEGQDRDIQLSKASADRAFAIARQKKFFAIACEASGIAVAFQGKKTLSYTGPDGKGSCTYNYSKDPQIQWLTTEFQGLASTLEEGRRLDLEHEHGRLTIDAELETLENLVHNGQATELETIAPTLRAIVADDRVMERAQRRARKLLIMGEGQQTGK